MVMDSHKEYFSSLNDEIADVFIYLLAICNYYQIDLLNALKDKEKMNLERFWK